MSPSLSNLEIYVWKIVRESISYPVVENFLLVVEVLVELILYVNIVVLVFVEIRVMVSEGQNL